MKQDKNSLVPAHLGIILDGNRRWAKEEDLPQYEGHKKGYENLKTIGIAAINRGVKYVSAYVFSTNNWHRSREEVAYLMKLLLWVAKNEVKVLNKEGIRVRFMGSPEKLSAAVLRAIRAAEETTKHNARGTLILCLNYSGKEEIAAATTKLLAKISKNTTVTPEMIEQNLYSPDIPPVDLIIRTSGEQRISDFMLWRAAYSELLFVDTYWPDFTRADLDNAFTAYSKRKRRFGK